MYSGGGSSAATAMSVPASNIRSNFFLRHKQGSFVCEFAGAFAVSNSVGARRKRFVLNKFPFAGCSVYMIVRRDAVGFGKCSGCDAHVVHIRNGGDNGIGVYHRIRFLPTDGWWGGSLAAR